MNVTIMIFVLAISNNWAWGEANGYLYWCPNDNPSLYDDELDTWQTYYYDECLDCSSGDWAMDKCREHADFEIGVEYEGFAMGWYDANIWTTGKQLVGSDFTNDDRETVLDVWFSDCADTKEKSICDLASWAGRNF